MEVTNIILAIILMTTTLMLATSYPAPSEDLESSVELSEFGKKVGVDLIELDSLDRDIRKHSEKVEGVSFLCTLQGQIAIPNECKKFHVCSRSGADSTSGICIGDKRFHHQQRQCVVMTEAECRATMCTKIGDVFPDPYSKDKFLVCKEMVPEVELCPEGLIFHAGFKNCTLGSILKGMKASFEEEVEKEVTKLVSKITIKS